MREKRRSDRKTLVGDPGPKLHDLVWAEGRAAVEALWDIADAKARNE